MGLFEKRIAEPKKTERPSFTIEEATNHFTQQYKCEEKRTYERPDWLPEIGNVQTEKIREISREEMVNIIKEKSNQSAPGSDGITYSILKNLEFVQDLIHILMNKILHMKQYPNQWRTGKAILIYKKGDASLPKNFRPICLTHTISKIFTSFLGNHLMKHMNTNKLMQKNPERFP